MPTPPSYQKVNPADQPILFLALSSPTLPLSTVDEYAETMMAQRISMVSGVAQVQVFGSQKYAVRVQLDPQRARHAAASASTRSRRRSQRPTSTCRPARSTGRTRRSRVQANGQLTDAAAYRPLIVAYRNGAPVRLEELGRVIDSVENDKVASWFNGRARRRPGHPAPAGHQHRRGRRRDQGAAADASAPQLPAVGRTSNIALRPLAVDPRVGARRASSRCCSRWRWWCW